MAFEALRKRRNTIIIDDDQEGLEKDFGVNFDHIRTTANTPPRSHSPNSNEKSKQQQNDSDSDSDYDFSDFWKPDGFDQALHSNPTSTFGKQTHPQFQFHYQSREQKEEKAKRKRKKPAHHRQPSSSSSSSSGKQKHSYFSSEGDKSPPTTTYGQFYFNSTTGRWEECEEIVISDDDNGGGDGDEEKEEKKKKLSFGDLGQTDEDMCTCSIPSSDVVDISNLNLPYLLRWVIANGKLNLHSRCFFICTKSTSESNSKSSSKRMYKQLALRIHPDKVPSHLVGDATAAFKILNDALSKA